MIDPRFDTACVGAAAPGCPSRPQLGLVSSSITISECRHRNGQHSAAIRSGEGVTVFCEIPIPIPGPVDAAMALETLSQLERLLQ
jgi:hypothetical protein